MIVHPAYNSSLPSSAVVGDLAVLKLEPRSDLGPVQWGPYTWPACLPSEARPGHCQVAGWAVTTQGQGSLRSAVLGHAAVLQDSRQCLQGSRIDAAVASDAVTCSSVRCNRFVSGPMFCKSQGSGEAHCNHCMHHCSVLKYLANYLHHCRSLSGGQSAQLWR